MVYGLRGEAEMMELILETARREERIRAAVMNGSRANPGAPRDEFQDYDIVYFVRDLPYFTKDTSFIGAFGRRIMLQMPETMRYPMGDGRFVYLMLFEDGNRIDLQLIPVEKARALLQKDSQSVLLLDKDGVLPPFPPASDRDYHVRRPSRLEYDSCCNNFWWCMQNVAKGICRDELPYAMGMLNEVVRAELHRMLGWYIGAENGFSVSTGKMGKYYKAYLTDEQYGLYADTYPNASHQSIWKSVFSMCGLFRAAATDVGRKLGLVYPAEDDRNMTAYLRRLYGKEASAGM